MLWLKAVCVTSRWLQDPTGGIYPTSRSGWETALWPRNCATRTLIKRMDAAALVHSGVFAPVQEVCIHSFSTLLLRLKRSIRQFDGISDCFQGSRATLRTGSLTPWSRGVCHTLETATTTGPDCTAGWSGTASSVQLSPTLNPWANRYSVYLNGMLLITRTATVLVLPEWLWSVCLWN